MEAELQELVPDEVRSSPLSEIYCLHRSSYKDAPADCFPLDVSKILPRVRRIVSIPSAPRPCPSDGCAKRCVGAWQSLGSLYLLRFRTWAGTWWSPPAAAWSTVTWRASRPGAAGESQGLVVLLNLFPTLM